jgi:hypothetical protein
MPSEEHKSIVGVQRLLSTVIGQVLQRTKRPPDKLVEYINLANLIPPVSQLPDSYKLNDEAYIDVLISKGGSVDSLDQLLPSISEATQEFLHRYLPPERFPQFYEYLGPICSSRVLKEVPDLYRKVYGTRAVLDLIADMQEKRTVVQDSGTEIPREAIPISVVLDVDSEGNLQLTQGPLLDALMGVPAGRIRRCSECQRIFWAGRIDKHACSDKCVNRRNVRIWRERYTEHYKIKRVRKADAAESTQRKSNHTTGRRSQ